MDTLELTVANGGGTFSVGVNDIVPRHFTTGYSVGVARGDAYIMRLKDADNYDIEGFMHSIAEAFAVEHVGTWVHDGAIVIDPVVLIESRSDAEAIGRALHQEAIYDNATQEVIAL